RASCEVPAHLISRGTTQATPNGTIRSANKLRRISTVLKQVQVQQWCLPGDFGRHIFLRKKESLTLLWQIFWHDWKSWDSRIRFSVTHGWSAYWRADHGRHDVTLGRRASKLAQAVFGSPGS